MSHGYWSALPLIALLAGCNTVGQVTVKGRAAAVDIFEVRAMAPAESEIPT